MVVTALSFLAGVLVLQRQAQLPPLYVLGMLPVAIAAGAGLMLLRPASATGRTVALAALLVVTSGAGFLWAAWHAHMRMGEVISAEAEGRDIEVTGVVAGLPVQTARGLRFEFEPEAAALPTPPLIRLVWYRRHAEPASDEEGVAESADDRVMPGDRWRFTVRLRRPHGNLNPQGFDYEAWLLERGIGATGYVRARSSPERLGQRNGWSDRVGRLRMSVRERFAAALGATPAAGILAALAVGDQAAIGAEDWRLFAVTGVTHLMSISGLHVTLVSGLLAALAGWIWRRFPGLCLRIPARRIAALGGIAGAFGYTVLAGYGVPAQRTCYMVTAVALALWSGRHVSSAGVLSLALIAVLLADPWAALAPGFWLSFIAVALIFYSAVPDRGERLHVLRQWVRVQWAITVGLAPAVLLWFGQVSIVGPLANAVAIPLVSAVITPLALIAALVPVESLLVFAARLTEGLLMFLEWCASLPLAAWQGAAPQAWTLVSAGLGALWLLAPHGMPWRSIGVLLFLPAFAQAPPGPAAGEAWVTALDVGQGLAVLVRTREHALLYDAGPAYGQDSDAGERVIVPVLRAMGITRLDALIITHSDTDHLGGASSVLGNLDVDRFLSSLPERHALRALVPLPERCVAGGRWSWDGVDFELLGPEAGAYGHARNNDLSCVLKLTAGGGTMLLTGDIEQAAEAALLSRHGRGLRSDVLLMPHHGSRTSSTMDFLSSVAPRHAIAAVGYRNRFGHPAQEVLRRYEDAGISVLRTDLDGAVRVDLGTSRYRVSTERGVDPRYWRSGRRI